MFPATGQALVRTNSPCCPRARSTACLARSYLAAACAGELQWRLTLHFIKSAGDDTRLQALYLSWGSRREMVQYSCHPTPSQTKPCPC